MGSPLSPIVANLYMEELEDQALEAATLRLRMWVRYVDDTFVLWPHDEKHLVNFHHTSTCNTQPYSSPWRGNNRTK